MHRHRRRGCRAQRAAAVLRTTLPLTILKAWLAEVPPGSVGAPIGRLGSRKPFRGSLPTLELQGTDFLKPPSATSAPRRIRARFHRSLVSHAGPFLLGHFTAVALRCCALSYPDEEDLLSGVVAAAMTR